MGKLKDCILLRKLQLIQKKLQVFLMGEHLYERKMFTKSQGYTPDLNTPKTLNEKIAWLKINYLKEYYYKACDKYLLHEYTKEKLGKDYAAELIFATKDPNELTFKNISKFPCIIKVSNGSGANLIVRSREQYSEGYLQNFFKKGIIMSEIHTTMSLEHQYDTEAYIVVESLLSDENGGIPNDYKFLYINGNLEFIYCSVDRLGDNVRHIYDSNWNRLHFAWVAGANKEIFDRYDASKSIPAPKNFSEMKKLSKIIAKDFPLVRVDFYDAREGLYIGEITLHHGSGHDAFYPKSFDSLYGEKLILPKKNR